MKKQGKEKIAKFCFVTFEVKVPFGYEKVFLSGNTKNLGEWNARKAIELKQKGDYFVARKRFPVGEVVEFKALCAKDWIGVEKGLFREEICNNSIIAGKKLVYTWQVPNFNN